MTYPLILRLLACSAALVALPFGSSASHAEKHPHKPADARPTDARPTDARPTDARATMLGDIKRSVTEYPALADAPSFRATLLAIAAIDRAQFVPEDKQAVAYRDTPLEIGFDQTISDPYIVAVMTAAVGTKIGANVLEIGTGSGYQAAVLSRIGATVHSIEIVEPLATAATARLQRLGFANIAIRAGDGFQGWAEAGPFDAIIVTAGASEIPAPLIDQLKIGGKLVMPIGQITEFEQLVLLTKTATGLTKCSLGPAMFVPLTGRGRSHNNFGLYDRTVTLCYHGQTARWPGQAIGQ